MAKNPEVKKFLAALQSNDPEVRTAAWLSAGKYAALPLKQLADLVAHGELETGRAARRAMWKIVRTVGAPGAEGKKATVKGLAELLEYDQPDAVRREVLWMLSEIGDGIEAVDPIAPLLEIPALREDARMVLERIPGAESLAALKVGFQRAPEEFKYNVAQSLRKRGVEVEGYPCQKMVPRRATQVKPA